MFYQMSVLAEVVQTSQSFHSRIVRVIHWFIGEYKLFVIFGMVCFHVVQTKLHGRTTTATATVTATTG